MDEKSLVVLSLQLFAFGIAVFNRYAKGETTTLNLAYPRRQGNLFSKTQNICQNIFVITIDFPVVLSLQLNTFGIAVFNPRCVKFAT